MFLLFATEREAGARTTFVVHLEFVALGALGALGNYIGRGSPGSRSLFAGVGHGCPRFSFWSYSAFYPVHPMHMALDLRILV